MSDGPVLAISDVHFGFKDDSAVRFKAFAKYLTDWVNHEETEIKTGETTGETLAAPQKIILIGDILDLWISRDSNTVRPYQQSFNPLSLLMALDREIAYVVGNHDWITRRCEGPHHPWFGEAPVTVYTNYYDPNGHGPDYPWQGVPIGKNRYLFLHGHQFDLFFNKRSLLRLGDVLGFSSASADEFTFFKVLGAVVFFLTVGLVLSPFFIDWLPSLLTSLTALTQNRWLAVGTLLLGWVAAVIASIGIVWVFNRLEKWYYLRRNPQHFWGGKNNNPEPMCRNSSQRLVGTYNFRQVEPHINADVNVFVFGHTHVPCIDTYKSPDGRRSRTLVNTGSWVKLDGNMCDTFVYVDESGPRLLHWDGDSSVSQLDRKLL